MLNHWCFLSNRCRYVLVLRLLSTDFTHWLTQFRNGRVSQHQPWLHQGPDCQKIMCQTEPNKKWLDLPGFLGKKFAGNLKDVGQIKPDNAKLVKSEILALSGTIWPSSFKFPANFWSMKPSL